MKKLIIPFIAAAFLFLAPSAQAIGLLSPGATGPLQPGLWVPNTASSTITPNPSSLQVPCANVVGDCGLSSSTAVTSITGTPGQVNVSQATGSVTLSLPQNINTTSTPTFSAITANSTSTPSFVQNLNSVQSFSSSSPLDPATQLNNLYAALPSTGGTIKVPTGVYPHSNEMLFNVLNKPVLIECGPGTSFVFTGTGTSTLFDISASGWNGGLQQNGYGMRDCNLVGPSASGTGGWTAGLVLGGQYGADGFVFSGGQITNFASGTVYSNSSWNTNFINSSIINNGQNVAYTATTNAGENNSSLHTLYILQNPFVTSSTNCIGSSVGYADMFFSEPSFDGCQLANTASGALDTNTTVNMGHFEPSGGEPWYPLVVNTGGANNVMSINQSDIVADKVSATGTAYMNNAGRMVINALNVLQNGPASDTLNSLINENTSTGSLALTSVYQYGSTPAFTSLVNSSTFSNVDFFYQTNNGAPIVGYNGQVCIGCQTASGTDYLPTSSVAFQVNGNIHLGNATSTDDNNAYTIDTGGQLTIAASTAAGSDGTDVSLILAAGQTASQGTIIFKTSNTQRGTITNAGNWMFGASSNPSTTVQVIDPSGASNSSTIRIGAVAKNACLEMEDEANTNNIDYLYVSSTALVVTSTKPIFCQ